MNNLYIIYLMYFFPSVNVAYFSSFQVFSLSRIKVASEYLFLRKKKPYLQKIIPFLCVKVPFLQIFFCQMVKFFVDQNTSVVDQNTSVVDQNTFAVCQNPPPKKINISKFHIGNSVYFQKKNKNNNNNKRQKTSVQ